MNIKRIYPLVLLCFLAACLPEETTIPAAEKWQMDKLEDYPLPYFEAIDSALLYHPEDARLHYRKGLYKLRRGDLIEGIAYLSQAAELDPEKYTNYLGYVKMHYFRDYKGAIEALETGLVLGKKDDLIVAGNTHLRLGIALMQQGKYQEAMKHFPDEERFSYSLIYRGIVKYRMKEYQAALTDFDKAISQFENCPEAYYHKAKTLLAMGQKEAACKSVQKAILNKGYLWNYPGRAHIEQLYPDLLDDVFDRSCR